jgi:predicted protein tyrosine phosphatase
MARPPECRLTRSRAGRIVPAKTEQPLEGRTAWMTVIPFALTDRRLTVCGLAEIASFRSERVSHVLSIADPGTPAERYFADYDAHHRLDLRFHDIVGPRPGEIPPSRDDVRAILDFGDTIAGHGDGVEHLLIHCHMGVSRSTAAMIMLLAQRHPDDAEAVVDCVVGIRPQAWPNSLMIEYAEAELRTGGTLRRAIEPQYRRVAAARPDFVTLLREIGRGGEVPEGF